MGLRSGHSSLVSQLQCAIGLPVFAMPNAHYPYWIVGQACYLIRAAGISRLVKRV
jgi:hypothetical protein